MFVDFLNLFFFCVSQISGWFVMLTPLKNSLNEVCLRNRSTWTI